MYRDAEWNKKFPRSLITEVTRNDNSRMAVTGMRWGGPVGRGVGDTGFDPFKFTVKTEDVFVIISLPNRNLRCTTDDIDPFGEVHFQVSDHQRQCHPAASTASETMA
jgi:hypothetical protein